jgi:macrolide transport system ATP-binding/permease protein
MSTPLLQLSKLRREYRSGDETIVALRDVDIDIHAGEMLAIVGASGSGKSTLMNILGCLDRPTSGSYRVAGIETGAMDADALAALRREHFGFIFQRYHLLGDLSAEANVEVPAVYAGRSRSARQERARELLQRLGMGDRLLHRPGQLSGGQQQRVSIARALTNGGAVILADEPTGALDSQTGAEVLRILEELHQEGHTIIIVTHDMSVAKHAQRIIQLADGVVTSDSRNDAIAQQRVERTLPHTQNGGTWTAMRDRFIEAVRMALLSMASHRLRTFLTMLGIIIGIASVVSVVALGEGSRQQILQNISALGTNTIDVFPGENFGDMRSGRVQTLRAEDADALALQPYVDSVTPTISTQSTARFGNISANTQINGVGEQFFRVRGLQIAEGVFFERDSIVGLEQIAVIDQNARKQFFGADDGAIGKVLLLGNVPVRVIGVTQARQGGFGNPDALNVWLPYTTVMARITGNPILRGITVRVADDASMEAAAAGLTRLLELRHGTKDFFISNTDEIRQTIEQTTRTMTLLVSAIALISLIVGGIGVMNIMLVSVTERTGEIGVRMAVGARQSDILQQFLIEAVLVCLIGGVLGVLLALVTGFAFGKFSEDFKMIISIGSIAAAFGCSTLIGVVFGFLPARNAARLDPVEALARL